MKRQLLFAIALALSPSVAVACGTERWPVKVGTDASAALVKLAPEPATVSELGSIAAPRDPDALRSKRFPQELHTFEVRGELTMIKREADGDLHMVLTGADGSHMIAEAPDPQCAGGSRFLPQITRVREKLNAAFGPIDYARHPDVNVVVTGVFFFDRPHGQDGVAPNAAELHPVLGISLSQSARQ